MEITSNILSEYLYRELDADLYSIEREIEIDEHKYLANELHNQLCDELSNINSNLGLALLS